MLCARTLARIRSSNLFRVGAAAQRKAGIAAAPSTRSTCEAGTGSAKWKPWAYPQPSAFADADLLLGLDALGDHADPDRVRHLTDRPHDRGVVGALGEVLDEGAVELDHREREPLQVAERGEADTEVVEDQPHAEALEGAEGPLHVDRCRRAAWSRSAPARASRDRSRSRVIDPSMCESSSGSASWRAERLTATPTGAESGWSCCQTAAWRQACSITQRPIGTIRRDSSATGMKASGPIRPRSGWFQRSSASIATIEPSRSLTTGW